MPQDDLTFTPRETAEILRKQKANLEITRHRYRFRWRKCLVSAAIGAILLPILWFSDATTWSPVGLSTAIAVGAGAGTLMYSLFVLQVRYGTAVGERQIDLQLLKVGAQELQATIKEDFFTKLVQINFKYIEQYYEQTQRQANKSFALSAFASIVGLGIISTGVAMMFRDYVEPAYVTAAAGVVSQFIAAVFFYLYNQTIIKMGEYHQKLVVTQNMSLALKISEGLEGEAKNAAQCQLIDRLSENINLYLTQGSKGGRGDG
jgi:hypothetical protein